MNTSMSSWVAPWHSMVVDSSVNMVNLSLLITLLAFEQQYQPLRHRRFHLACFRANALVALERLDRGPEKDLEGRLRRFRSGDSPHSLSHGSAQYVLDRTDFVSFRFSSIITYRDDGTHDGWPVVKDCALRDWNSLLLSGSLFSSDVCHMLVELSLIEFPHER